MANLWVNVALASAAAGPGAWHADPEAGVRFPVPFAQGQEKTGAQVQALVLERPMATLPEAVRYTSGVYAKAGVPFVIVWLRDEPAPTVDQLARLEAAPPGEAEARYGLTGWHFDRATMRGTGAAALPGGLKARVLVQIARGGTVQVGYYYREDGDAAGFDALAAGFEVAPERRLAPDGLARGPAAAVRAAAVALVFAATAGGLWRWRRRRPEPAAPPA